MGEELRQTISERDNALKDLDEKRLMIEVYQNQCDTLQVQREEMRDQLLQARKERDKAESELEMQHLLREETRVRERDEWQKLRPSIVDLEKKNKDLSATNDELKQYVNNLQHWAQKIVDLKDDSV